MEEKEDPFVESNKIPGAHLKSVCRYRKGESTCKYIVFRKSAFFCAKNVKSAKDGIDKLKDMKAKSDNCVGL